MTEPRIAESLLEVRDYEGMGFKPLIYFGGWRVAILRYVDEIQPDRIATMERHMETDEVFVLLRGRGNLILGGNGDKCEGILSQAMEIGRIYNVKKFAWHTILLSRDASVLLMENHDTDEQNSEYDTLSAKQRALIVETAQRERFL
jgi:hypothetical protein